MCTGVRPLAERCHLDLPVSFGLILEVVHVTACLRILSVLGLSDFSFSQVQQVSVILHDKISPFETTHSEYPSPLAVYVFDLFTVKMYTGLANVA